MKIAFKTGFLRLYIVFAALWIGIGTCALIFSSFSLFGLFMVILPPPTVLALGFVVGWVLSGFMPKSVQHDPPAANEVSSSLSAYLDEALKWVFVQLSLSLRQDGCEIEPSAMPEDMRSAIVQYLFGATLAMQEDLQDAQGASKWVIESRLQILQWVIIPVDEARGLLEVSRFNGAVPNHFASFVVLGAAAIRDLIESSRTREDMRAWAESYKGEFLASARIFTNYR